MTECFAEKKQNKNSLKTNWE